MADMAIDRSARQDQLLSDLAIGLAFLQQLGNDPLLWRQLLHCPRIRCRALTQSLYLRRTDRQVRPYFWQGPTGEQGGNTVTNDGAVCEIFT